MAASPAIWRDQIVVHGMDGHVWVLRRSDGRILWRHALRPSSLTLLTVAGLNVGQLIGGALIVEVIFHLNGLGFAIADAINRRQYIALQDYIAVVAIVYVVVNFAVDGLYRVIDPRIRGARIG